MVELCVIALEPCLALKVLCWARPAALKAFKQSAVITDGDEVVVVVVLVVVVVGAGVVVVIADFVVPPFGKILSSNFPVLVSYKANAL